MALEDVNKKKVAALVLTLVLSFEGYTHRAIIPVPGDPPTACRGHVVTNGQTVFTDEECDMLTNADINAVIAAISADIPKDAPPGVVGAVGDFCYNVGIQKCKASTLYRYIREGQYLKACDEFPKWELAHGKVYKGLVRRRQAERNLCMKGIQ